MAKELEAASKHAQPYSIEVVRTVHAHAEHLAADANRILTRCLTGQTDARQLTQDLHAIDRSAATIRAVLCRLHGSTR